MTRPLRVEFSGAVYHITSRGNARGPIFSDERDKKYFLNVLCAVVKRFNWLCHAYCLMNNHYHLLIETPEGNLSKGMRQLNGEYTQLFNRKHRRVGHLFQGRYKAILVDKDNYLLSLCRYIILNPVRAGIVKDPEEWEWSSYRSTVRKNEVISCLTVDWILSQFDTNRSAAISKYKNFVAGWRKAESPWAVLRGQIVLGKTDFIRKITELVKSKQGIKEVPRIQRYVTRPSLRELLNKGKAGDGEQLEKTVFEAYTTYGYTMKEIAEELRVHYSTVSRVIRRVEDREWTE